VVALLVVVVGPVVVGGVVVVVVGSDAEDGPEDEPVVVAGTVVEAAVPDIDVLADGLVADAERAEVSEATRIPSPTAAAVETIPIAAASRRTRVTARSRAHPAGWGKRRGCRDGGRAMSCPFGEASMGRYVSGGASVQWELLMTSLDPVACNVSSVRTVGCL
jgi:hypothetical protein